MVRVQVPATIANFGPGFDCIGAAVRLYNYIEVEFFSLPKVHVTGEGSNVLPLNEKNLVYRAARTVLEKLNVRKNLYIKLENHIPLARGLGSSAACIAGGMMAANRLLGDPLSREEIIRLATEMEGHPDNVVAAINGGFTLSMLSERGVIYKKLLLPEDLRFVIAVPDFELKTEDARRVIPKRVKLRDAVFNISRVALLVAGIAQGDFSHMDVLSKDMLHQPYRSSLIPGMREILKNAPEKGMLACFLSGAGPSIAGLVYENKAEEAGRFMVEAFRRKNISARYLVLELCREGLSFIE
ncbi:homoserine kinase [Thermosediminibacter litoriperuensis]|uniref:Homoserine kinase n=1 Tax=Thermosediminibacter litoriperuensis TaxID=291989 RepID=A0A5S5AS98_9FIRM|nr:homoserine kinase [Thermosediminibacter litoriperuensis]TYP54910.1 homoserine kinase [Thermosediminibacter litoriperuensis]